MNKDIMAFMAILAFLATPIAQAETIQIGAGSQDGEYTNVIVPALSKALEKYGYDATPTVSAGSQENLEKVWSGELPVGLSQQDVAALNLVGERPSSAKGELVLLGRIAPEALFCTAKKGGKVASYDDLTDKLKPGLKVSVGKEGSGTARTLEYLIKLDPNLEQINLLKEGNPAVQLNRLLSGGRDLVCFVMMPNLDNELIKTVLNHERLGFININKPAFTKAMIGEIQVYELMEIPVSKGFFGFKAKKITTLVTWVGAVANDQLTDEKLLSALAKISLQKNILPSNSLAGKAKDLFEKLKAKVID